MKKFNITGNCLPSKHYMVDITDKIAKIVKLVDYGEYFTINRARQYGKTTTLDLLEIKLKELGYTVAYLSFEGLSDNHFESPESFCKMFMNKMRKYLKNDQWFNDNVNDFESLSEHIEDLCNDKKIVVFIDEVDKTSNNIIFLYFLGMLRNGYLKRMKQATFHSVILAGVTDIKNIKYQLVNKGLVVLGENEGSHNSPWNIAAQFNVDMSFNPIEIASMLIDYEKDNNSGMDISLISEEIYHYTSGYPFLVSRICKLIDEELPSKDWTSEGVKKAVKFILKENNTLFDDLFKNLENNKELYNFIYGILILGEQKSYKLGNPVVNLGKMFGFISNKDDSAVISNRVFETLIYEYFISKDETALVRKNITGVIKEDIVENGKFNMQLCLEKFAIHYHELFSERDIDFLERQGRMIFLTYLKPLINGHGFYHVESETRNIRRMDIVLDYDKQQFIIELKIWRGDSEHQKAYEQLVGYLNSKNTHTGYLLTFDFRKDVNKVRKSEWVEIGDKRIFDVII